MIRSRYAPTPSGYLHEGNLYNFFLVQAWMQALGGEIVLRIDDQDQDRIREEYLENLFQVLAQAGLRWDVGPHNPQELRAQFSQVSRRNLYAQHLENLAQSGQVFACTCSRTELAGRPYPGTCLNKGLPLDHPEAAWRLITPNTGEIRWQDQALGPVLFIWDQLEPYPIVRKRDGQAAYHLCTLADDQHFGITHVVRGQDLLSSTAFQLFLAERLGLGFAHVHFLHHPLLTDAHGQKLSKSAGRFQLAPVWTPEKLTWLRLQAHSFFRSLG